MSDSDGTRSGSVSWIQTRLDILTVTTRTGCVRVNILNLNEYICSLDLILTVAVFKMIPFRCQRSSVHTGVSTFWWNGCTKVKYQSRHASIDDRTMHNKILNRGEHYKTVIMTFPSLSGLSLLMVRRVPPYLFLTLVVLYTLYTQKLNVQLDPCQVMSNSFIKQILKQIKNATRRKYTTHKVKIREAGSVICWFKH